MAHAGNSNMTIRVFAASDSMPQPADLQSWLDEHGHSAPLNVTGDDLGWLSIEFTAPSLDATIRIERYLTEEDDLRDELDTWAGWVENQPECEATTRLMQQIITTGQVFTIRAVASTNDANLITELEAIARWYARAAGGVYQMDGRGLCSASGDVLITEV